MLGVNSIPIVGVLVGDWSPATALSVYWCENLIAALLIAARLALHAAGTTALKNRPQRPIRVVLVHLSIIAGMFLLAWLERPDAFFAFFAFFVGCKVLSDATSLLPRVDPGTPGAPPKWLSRIMRRFPRQNGETFEEYWRRTHQGDDQGSGPRRLGGAGRAGVSGRKGDRGHEAAGSAPAVAARPTSRSSSTTTSCNGVGLTRKPSHPASSARRTVSAPT